MTPNPTPPREDAPELREAIAKIVYERGMLFLHTGKPAWVDRGNSLAQTEARAMAATIIDICRADQPARVGVNPLVWTRGTRADDRTAHCECGTFAVGSDDAGGWFAVLRLIDGEGQMADVDIGWAETRELAMDDCEHERAVRILAAIPPDPEPHPPTTPSSAVTVSVWASLRAEVKRLQHALRPFADYMQTDEGRLDLDHLGNEVPDDQGVGWVYLTHGDFRAALRVLAGEAS